MRRFVSVLAVAWSFLDRKKISTATGILICHRRSYLPPCLLFFPRSFGAAGGAGRSRSRPGCLIRLRSDPDSPPSPYRKENLSNLNAAVASSLLQTLDENIAARRARVRAYQDLLRSDERLRLIAHQPGSACLSQVVRVLPGRRGNDLSAHLVDALHSAGLRSSRELCSNPSFGLLPNLGSAALAICGTGLERFDRASL